MSNSKDIDNFEKVLIDINNFTKAKKHLKFYDALIKTKGVNPEVKREAFIARSKLSMISRTLIGLDKS